MTDPNNKLTGSTATCCDYLASRHLSPEDQARLNIQWIDHQTATKKRNLGMLATSPFGVIAIPLNGNQSSAIARNWYPAGETDEACHLKQINEWRETQGLEPAKKVPKYILPIDCDSRFYDPYALLNPGTNEPVLLATEDVIGAARAALLGLRVISTFGVWLTSNVELEESQSDPEWGHELRGFFPAFLADSDAIEKPGVFRALVRTGFTVGCHVGYFPSTDRTKVGFDEWLTSQCDNPNIKQELEALIEANSHDALSLLELVLPNVDALLEERGYNKTESLNISGPLRRSTIDELLKHHRLDDLRADGFYSRVLKPLGQTLDRLKPRERDIRGERGEESSSTAELIIELVRAECQLFHDSEKNCYADIVIDDCRHTYPVKSGDFKRWVARRLYEEHEISPNSDAYQAARNTIEAIACFDGLEDRVWLRTAELNGKTYLDLANERWQAVEIDSQGWRIVDRPPARFIRPNTMLPLPNPVQGGRLDDLRNLLGLESDENSWVLLVTFLLFAYTQGPTFPVLLLVAARGSGKTTIAEFIKSLIDPGKAGLTQLVSDEHKMAVAAKRRWLMAYDNVSSLSPSESDTLCRISTGFGLTTRTLFTTEDETCFEACRPQIVTAIDHVVVRDDLSDRLLTGHLPPIDPTKRKCKRDLDAQLEVLRPKILGALLTALSKTLEALPHTSKDGLPRMADYGHFAIAAESALGLEPGRFIEVFSQNREASRQVVLEASPLAEAIQALVTRETYFKGTPTQLLKMLEEFAEPSVVRSRFWPRASNTLGRQLNRLKPDLEAVGLIVELGREGTGNHQARLISISKREVLDEF
jgi:hypothetical protein